MKNNKEEKKETSNQKNETLDENKADNNISASDVSVSDLLKQIEEKDRSSKEYYDQLLRLKAEFENYRKRVEREKENHRLWGKEEILMKQISLYDVIVQAVDLARTTKNIESIIVGLEMIQKEFEKVLNSEGISEIDTSGNLDPYLHEVVETVVDESQQDGKIVSVLQRGYIFNERIIRPAKVKIVKNEVKADADSKIQHVGKGRSEKKEIEKN